MKNINVAPINEFPSCFDSMAEYKAWLKAAKMTHMPSARYCSDCLPEFQKQMCGARRCWHPSTQFVRDREGAVIGIRRAPGTNKSEAVV